MVKQFSIRESLKTSWSLIKGENLFLLIGLILGYLVVYGVLSTVRLFMPTSIIGFIVSLAQIFLSLMFSLGIVKISLQIIAGEEPEFTAFKDVIPLTLKYIGASLLRALPAIGGIIIGIVVILSMLFTRLDLASIKAGDINSIVKTIDASKNISLFLGIFALSILPAIYFNVRWIFYTYLIVDKNSGAIESLKQSWKMTEGNFWHLILFGLTYFALIILGFIALILGVFVVIPLLLMALTFIYKKLVSKLEENQPLVDSVEKLAE